MDIDYTLLTNFEWIILKNWQEEIPEQLLYTLANLWLDCGKVDGDLEGEEDTEERSYLRSGGCRGSKPEVQDEIVQQILAGEGRVQAHFSIPFQGQEGGGSEDSSVVEEY